MRILVWLGLALAKLGGWREPICSLPHLPEEVEVDLGKAVVAEVQLKMPDAPGPIKAREAARMLMNIRPELTPREVNLIIEVALAR